MLSCFSFRRFITMSPDLLGLTVLTECDFVIRGVAAETRSRNSQAGSSQ